MRAFWPSPSGGFVTIFISSIFIHLLSVTVTPNFLCVQWSVFSHSTTTGSNVYIKISPVSNAHCPRSKSCHLLVQVFLDGQKQ